MCEQSRPVLTVCQFNELIQPLCGRLRSCRYLGAALGKFFHPFDGHGEIEILSLGEIESGQPHQRAVLIVQPAATGTGRNGCSGLDVAATIDLAQAGNDTVRQREFQTLRRANSIDFRAHFKGFGTADNSGLIRHPSNAERAHISIPVGISQLCGVFLLPDPHLQLTGALHHMAVGDHVPVRQNHSAAHTLCHPIAVDVPDNYGTT